MGTIALPHLLGATLAYLGVLFAIAYASARAPALRRLAAHPWTYTLGLGVYASSWTYYGSVGFAARHGLTFLAVYMGATLACLAVPLVWAPVLRLSRDHRLASVADLLAFRFGGRRVGATVTLFALVASVPYVAQQLRAVDEAARAALGGEPGPLGGLVVTALLALFAMAFGASGGGPHERHEGLGVAVAFESLVKLAAMLAAGAAALFGVLGGPSGLAAFLEARPGAMESLLAPVHRGTGFGAVLLLSFGAAFLLPRQFHMAFAEGAKDGALRFAAIGFPVFLILLNLGVLPVLWAGSAVAPAAAPESYVLAVPRALGSPALGVFVFIGGVSAASAMLIVTTIALAGMCVNHLVLPARLDVLRVDPYRRVKWLRRALMGAIVVLGYTFDRLQAQRGPLVVTGLVSFIAFAQLLPGLFALLFWKRATRAGFFSGLAAGAAVWALTALAPLFGAAQILATYGAVLGLDPGDVWTLPTIVSLSLNGALLFAVSLRTPQGEDEARSAEVCAERDLVAPPAAPPRTFDELRERLTRALGRLAAEQEIARAVAEAGVSDGDARAAVPAQVAAAVERNLSGMFGPVLARLVLDARRASLDEGTAWADQLRFLEGRLREAPADLTGAAAQLDGLRRYLRAVLEELPIGVCALGPDESVILWNRALTVITDIEAAQAAGAPLSALPPPWGEALHGAAVDPGGARELEVHDGGAARVLFARKATVDRSVLPGAQDGSGPFGLVLLIEDRTERRALEAELAHKDRLASIGRLAAGVAHEIGNPLTGIACLAQNLETEESSGEVRDRARSILAETRRIDGIVRSLLGYSRSGGGGAASLRPRVERVSLPFVVEEALRLVRVDRAAKRASLQSAVADDLEVLGDAQRLVQVLVNLLTNACDASDEGGLVLVTGDAEDGEAVIRVVDHGAGIPADVQARMFEPFFTTKEPARGTGLGLSVVHQIVEEHGGSLAVESEEGVGATMIVRLPLAPSPGEDGVEERAADGPDSRGRG